MSRRAPLLPLITALALAFGAGAHARASEPAGRAAESKPRPVPHKSEEEMLQTLRERLAAKLGNTERAVQKKQPGLVRVTTRDEAPDNAAPAPQRAPTPARVAARAAAPKPTADGAKAPSAAHWSYGGETGPKAWGGLRPDFNLCASGSRQSPIDIRSGIAVDLEPVQFDYRASPFRVVDNGHTVQVNIEPGNSIVTRGERYDLVQFHFHRPAEERIDGKSFDMSLHLVHRSAEGKLAVVGLLMNRGDAAPVVQTVWNNLPLEKHEEVRTRDVLDLNHILPADRGYFTYMGSLTTPPCSEGVLWMVMRQPVAISAAQIEVFSRLYPMNARPVQQAAGRMIKQSN